MREPLTIIFTVTKPTYNNCGSFTEETPEAEDDPGPPLGDIRKNEQSQDLGSLLVFLTLFSSLLALIELTHTP